jgi:hypothetical protein
MKIYHDLYLAPPEEIRNMPNTEMEEDEIKKYSNLFKIKVEKNNVEELNQQLMMAHQAD